MKRRHFLLTLAAALAAAHSKAQSLAGRFATVQLPYRASIQLPRSWVIVQGSTRIAIADSAAATIDLTRGATRSGRDEALLIAHFPDAQLYAAVSITTSADSSFVPNFIGGLSDSQVLNFGREFRKLVESGHAQMRVQISNWSPTRKDKIGSKDVLYTSYVKEMPFGPTRSHVFQFFSIGRSFTIVASSRLNIESANAPVLDRIVESFRMGGR